MLTRPIRKKFSKKIRERIASVSNIAIFGLDILNIVISINLGYRSVLVHTVCIRVYLSKYM